MAGNISCAAINIEGQSESQPIHLDIKCRSFVFTLTTISIRILIMKAVNIDMESLDSIKIEIEHNWLLSDIFITDPPVCKPGLTRFFGVSRAENVEISCQVEANPNQDLNYKWFFNNSAETIEVPRSRYNNSRTASVLTYKPLASLDYGTLLCFASNSAGLQSEPCVFHILTAGERIVETELK